MLKLTFNRTNLELKHFKIYVTKENNANTQQKTKIFECHNMDLNIPS